MKKEYKDLGCVYFFKHKNSDCIKIGLSANPSPIGRFKSFLTYAPFGGEIIDFILTNDYANLETTLHKQYNHKRLAGEWFDITKQDVNDIVNFYSKDYNKPLKEKILIKARCEAISTHTNIFNNLPLNTIIENDSFYSQYDGMGLSKVHIKNKLVLYCRSNGFKVERKLLKKRGVVKRVFTLSLL